MKTISSGIFLFLSFLLITLPLRATANEGDKTLTLVGVVVDNQTPLKGVQIKLYEGEILIEEGMTDVKGNFTFTLLPDRNYKVVVDKFGYTQKSIRIRTPKVATKALNKFECTIELQRDKTKRLSNATGT